MEIHGEALKHGITGADIEHTIEHAMKLDIRTTGACVYLGPSRSGAILEVVKVIGLELVIHARKATRKHERLLSGHRALR